MYYYILGSTILFRFVPGHGWCMGSTLFFWDQLKEHPCPKNDSITCPKTIKSGWVLGSIKCPTSTWVSAIGFQLMVNEFRKAWTGLSLNLNHVTQTTNPEYKSWVWRHARSHLSFSFSWARSDHICTRGWILGGYTDRIWLKTRGGDNNHNHTRFIVYLALNGTLIYELNMCCIEEHLKIEIETINSPGNCSQRK